MSPASVFIFDSSYPSIDIALPIDDAVPHIVVSDREIEPPPGHKDLKLEEVTGFKSFRRNVGLLRDGWHKARGEKCVVIAAFGMRREQLLLNLLYALLLCRNVLLFDGTVFRPFSRSGAVVFRSLASVLARRTLGPLKSRFRAWQLNRRLKSDPGAATPEGQLFGLYNRERSFSLPLDRVVQQPGDASVYGSYTRGWYLPTLSNHLQRYKVQTTRHRLRDVLLHVEWVEGGPERFLFKSGKILDYPYLLLTQARHQFKVAVSTRAETKSIERGIDMLAFTTSYYHWLVDGVPRILDLIDDGVDFDQYPLILPPLELFQRQLLEVLGISPDHQVVTVGQDDWCHVSECILPTVHFPLAAPGLDDYWTQPNGEMLQRIRDRILARLPSPAAGSPKTEKRVYISRAKAGRRRLTAQSEAAVRAVLEPEGFRTVVLEEMPWAEQARLLSGAEFVVGLHGAGLTNILFAKSATLLELQNPLQARAYFAVLARELKMRYAYVIGKLDGNSENFDNIVIDPSEVAAMMQRIDLDR